MHPTGQLADASSADLAGAAHTASRDWPPWIALVGVAGAYYVGALVGLALTAPPFPLSVLWPPNALLLAALLLAPQRWWWMLVAAAFPAHLLAELQQNVPLAMVLCWFVSNVCEALIGAAFVRGLAGTQAGLSNVRAVIVVCGAAALAPFLS